MPEARRQLVVHIIPNDGIGGVETAARSLPDGTYSSFEFTKCYLVRTPGVDTRALTSYASHNDPRALLSAAWRLARMKPAVAIASLWRSCIVLLALKLVRPRLRAVTFLHFPKDVHWLDRIFNRLAMHCSAEIWTDSHATAGRVPRSLQGRVRVVSFLTTKAAESSPGIPGPRFVFWGRLHPQKGLDRALRIFARVQEAYPEATFNIIGPDGGERKKLEEQVLGLALRGVSFDGPLPREAILTRARNCSFYLQPSLEEGAAMSVIEAMQLGLVPVVTPVGEIRFYCRDGSNALLIRDDASAAKGVERLLHDERLYRSVSAAAFDTWCDRPLYKDDVISRCSAMLG